MYPYSTILFKSQRVCAACRRGKKQCDKIIPRCSRCVRKSFRCDYTAPVDNLVSYNQISTSDEAETGSIVLLSADSCFPHLTELGWSLLIKSACRTSTPQGETIGLSILIRRVLNASNTSLAGAVTKFRNTVYPWFPVVDPEALIRGIESAGDENANDTSALLILCMHILTQTPCQHETHMTSNSLYLAAKRLFFLFQNTDGQLPVELLQAGILITLYECSHAIWNSAYLSLANCVALSRVAGLQPATNDSGNTLWKTCGWAVVLLDRLILLLNTDNPHPSLILEESRHDTNWPMTQGDLPASDGDSHNSAQLMKFYVAAQSAYHLGPALRYVSLSKGGFTIPPSFESIDASVTESTSKLLSMSQIRPLYLCNTTAFTISVLVSLRVTHYLSKPQQTQANMEAMMSLRSVLNMAHEMVRTSTEMTSNIQIGDVSFIGLVSVLRAAINLVIVKGKDLDIKEWDEIENLLLRFSQRWIIGVQLLKEFTQHKQTTWGS